MLERVIWGILLGAIGIIAVIYARKIVEFTGTSATLERYLGGGGTYLGLRIFGVLMTLFGTLYIFGFLNQALEGIIGIFK